MQERCQDKEQFMNDFIGMYCLIMFYSLSGWNQEELEHVVSVIQFEIQRKYKFGKALV